VIRVRNTQVILPTNGTLQIFSTGYFTYTPNPGFTGVDSFTYTARDDLNAISNASVVTITVDPAPANQAPVAVNDYKWMKHNWAGIIYVLANDTDDGTLDPSTVTLVTPPAKGGNMATVNANGTITFTAGPGFRGSDTFEYTVRDNDGVVSNIATVQVDVVR
jgi:hypothetical protein